MSNLTNSFIYFIFIIIIFIRSNIFYQTLKLMNLNKLILEMKEFKYIIFHLFIDFA